MTKHPKRRRDLNQWAKLMVDLATKQVEDRELTPEERSVDPARHLTPDPTARAASAAAVSPPHSN
jgi:hypothetical protein